LSGDRIFCNEKHYTIFQSYLFSHLKVSLLSTNNNTMNYFSTDFKLGILGGGQLGKMMLLTLGI
jgi:hypothetical protein